MGEREADLLLVERAQRGDRHAFGLLVAKYQRKLLRLIQRLVPDPAAAEDVAQEAFIKAYRALPNFRGESAFYTWLYRIAVNAAKNWLASEGRTLTAVSEAADEEGEEEENHALWRDEETPDRLLLSKEIGETVSRAVEALPEELRMALILREIDGLSYEEIAQVMDCPIGTVRSRIFRAREAVAAKLRPLLDISGDRRW
ncbi:MAG: RNA polymerase sigma factor RpoE [Rhodocyclaceae bacterium]|nr:RNA polymerase sigma factor RpoE [Rhodocyclaceae bacterium]